MKYQLLLASIAGCVLGIVVGGFFASNASVHNGAADARQNQASAVSPKPTSPLKNPVPPRSDVLNQFRQVDSMQPAAAGGKPTAEEQLAIQELSRRARAGEYILGSDNPFILRIRREMLEQAIEDSVPPIIAGRHQLLSTLNADPATIGKLTNHAARIAEASWSVAPLLAEISTAKVEYDSKARELLTPEQYERFKEFETRQTFAREWRRFGIEGLEDLPLADINAVTRSLEELGIREKTSSSILPYEPEPSSGNWITGANSNLEEIIQSKIGRVDAAAVDFGVIATRNNLSDKAQQVLESIIVNRGASLREQLRGLGRTDEEQRDFRAMIEARLGRPPN